MVIRNSGVKVVTTYAPAVQLLFTPVVEMSRGGCIVVAVDTAAVQLGYFK